MSDQEPDKRPTNTDLAVGMFVLVAVAILAGLLLPHDTRPAYATAPKPQVESHG